MILKPFDELPEGLRCEELRRYHELLQKKKLQLVIKRAFDLGLSAFLLILLALPMIVIAVLICLDSPGGAMFRQERVTQYGRIFRIHKFRTMVKNADRMGTAVTTSGDARVTAIGEKLRRYRLDELPQLLDVLAGDMSFVGTRPEVPKYVRRYAPAMRATLLLPAGITSEASIAYKDEAKLLDGAADADEVYVKRILPEKMKINLRALRKFGLLSEVRTMFRTVAAVFKED